MYLHKLLRVKFLDILSGFVMRYENIVIERGF